MTNRFMENGENVVTVMGIPDNLSGPAFRCIFLQKDAASIRNARAINI
jgi:hypothetical protein